MRFRTKALAKRRQAEELDRLPEVAKPRGWLAALALAVVVVGVLIFTLTGTIPRRVEADGVLTSRGGIIEVQSDKSGEVVELLVEVGESVDANTPVAEIRGSGGETETLTSGFSGQVLEVRTGAGRVLRPGSEVITLAGEPGEKPSAAFLFLPQSTASGVAPGMSVDVNVSAAPTQVYGVVRGRVETVSGAPISPQEMDVLLSNDALVEQFTVDGPPVLATVSLETGETASGLDFSSGDGPDFPLRPGTLVAADVQQGDEAVLDVVLGK